MNYEHLYLMPNLLNTYKNNYVMILFKHAFVILLTVGYFFWSRSYMSIGRMENPWKFVFKII